MRRVPDFALGFLLATAIGVVILLFVTDPQTYHQICETNQYSGKESCTPHNIIYVVIWHVGHWFDVSAAVITAVATGFIARFTFTLKRSTDNLWNSSIKQATIAEDALTQLERPYLFVFGVRGIRQDPETGEFYVEYSVANYGKMPAIIEAPHIGFGISDRAEPPIPPLLFDGHSLLASPILQAGEQRRRIREYFPAGMVGEGVNVRIERIVRTSDVDPNQMLREGGPIPSPDVVPAFNIPDGFDIFFRAVVRYRGPFTTHHETGALWLYNTHSFEFAGRGGDEYNYVK